MKLQLIKCYQMITFYVYINHNETIFFISKISFRENEINPYNINIIFVFFLNNIIS